MAELTSKERVNRLFRREPIDRMPVFSGYGMVTVQAIKDIGIRFAEVHTTGENLARSAMRNTEMWDLDAVVIPYDMCTIAEALGRGTSLYMDSEDILYPTVPTKWESFDEVDLPDDFLTKARMPEVDKGLEMCKKNGDMAVGAWLLGPFTQAGQVLELGLLLKGMKKNKDAVEGFLKKMTDLTIKAAKHYESLGVDFITIREMGSGTDLLSPRMWKGFIKDNLTRIFDSINIPTVNHICGSTDLIVEMMHECGADAVSVDQKNNLAESRKKLGNDALIFGNFDPYGTLVQGEPSAVAGIIEKCIDDGADAVWPGCDLWPDVNSESMNNYVATVKEYGKKASPAVGRL